MYVASIDMTKYSSQGRFVRLLSIDIRIWICFVCHQDKQSDRVATMFDVKKFLQETYCDADGVVGLLRAYGVSSPPKDTIRKWFSRASIPAQWFAVLIAVMELERGAPLRLAGFLNGGKNGARTRSTDRSASVLGGDA
jgi:hypothetical protein